MENGDSQFAIPGPGPKRQQVSVVRNRMRGADRSGSKFVGLYKSRDLGGGWCRAGKQCGGRACNVRYPLQLFDVQTMPCSQCQELWSLHPWTFPGQCAPIWNSALIGQPQHVILSLAFYLALSWFWLRGRREGRRGLWSFTY